MNGIKYAGGTLERMDSGVWRISAVKDGRQVRRRFKRKVDAERFLESIRDGRKPLTPAQVAEAQSAFGILTEAGLDKPLPDIVREWLGSARLTPKTTSDALKEYLADIEASVSSKTYVRYRCSLALFAKEASSELRSIGVEEVKDFIARHTSPEHPESFKSCRVTLGTFFNWCKTRKYMADNPVDLIRPPRTKDMRVEFYSPEEVAKVMALTMEEDPALGPYLILGFFAGLRPIERQRMTVEDNMVCDPDTGERWGALNITGDVAKGSGHERRYIELSFQCRQMMRFFESEFGELSGSIIPAAPVTTARRAKDAIRKAIGRYIQDGERHTYATHHFAAFENSALTAKLCGHSESVALKHYRGRISKRDGEVYFALTPEECGLGYFGPEVEGMPGMERRNLDARRLAP